MMFGTMPRLKKIAFRFARAIVNAKSRLTIGFLVDQADGTRDARLARVTRFPEERRFISDCRARI